MNTCTFTTLCALAFAGLHLLGWRYPARLWGVDQLHYYPMPVLIAFALLIPAIAALGPARRTWTGARRGAGRP